MVYNSIQARFSSTNDMHPFGSNNQVQNSTTFGRVSREFQDRCDTQARTPLSKRGLRVAGDMFSARQSKTFENRKVEDLLFYKGHQITRTYPQPHWIRTAETPIVRNPCVNTMFRGKGTHRWSETNSFSRRPPKKLRLFQATGQKIQLCRCLVAWLR